MSRYPTPHNISIEFEATVRLETVYVEAIAWSDDEGIYKTSLVDVTLDGVSVVGLLSEDVLSDLSDAIEPAIHAQASDNAVIGNIPGPYPTL